MSAEKAATPVLDLNRSNAVDHRKGRANPWLRGRAPKLAPSDAGFMEMEIIDDSLMRLFDFQEAMRHHATS